MTDRATNALEVPEEDRLPVGAPEAGSAEAMEASEIGVHSIVPKIAVGAVIWFIAVTWLSFAWDRQVDYLLVIVSLYFAFFFLIFLFTASYTLKDPRWHVREASLREFLVSDVGVGSETMTGRDVLIEIALIPVALAFAATLIGLAWVIFG